MNINNRPLSGLLSASVIALSLAACANMESKPQASLYERLGGKPAIAAVVENFVGNVAGDTRINQFFAHANIPRLKTQLTDQICEATGGPCHYSGADMKTAHAGMGIKQGDFNALVEDLVKSLDYFKVSKAEKDELLGALGSMQGDIVSAR